MAGKSPVATSDDQRAGLLALAGSRDRGGVAALKAHAAPGPAPMKSEAALRVVTPLLEEPVADRRNWTIPRLRAEIEARAGVRISRSQLSQGAAKKKFRWRR